VNANNNGLSVACGEGVLVITEAQMPGGKPQSVAALLNGHQDRLKLGVRFTLTGNNAHV
jgi:methionyl-tRNA formyltransferase